MHGAEDPNVGQIIERLAEVRRRLARRCGPGEAKLDTALIPLSEETERLLVLLRHRLTNADRAGK